MVLAAAACMLAAHIVRASRVALLFPPHSLSKRFNLLLGLAMGYAVNAVLPWRLGELVRAWFVSRRESIRFSYSAVVIVAERLSDMVVVAIVAAVLIAWTGSGWWSLPASLTGAALVLIAIGALVLRSAATRRLIWSAGSIFNDRIRFGIADFFWSLGELVTGGALLRPRYLLFTAWMWALYILSYAIFARATGFTLVEAVSILLGAPLRPATDMVARGNSLDTLPTLLFLGLPVLVVLAYGALRQLETILRFVTNRSRFGTATPLIPGGVHERFKATSEYQYFLISLFAGEHQTLTGFGLDALDDGIVHRLFAGGSDAITALVEVGGELVIRKFATGDPGDKLAVQSDWIKRYASPDLPLVEIVRERRGSGFYLYDMPLVVPADNFHDVIHTSSGERSRAVLDEVAERIHAFHLETARPDAVDEVVRTYLAAKASKNARIVLDFATGLLPGSSYSINGKSLDLGQWERLLDPDWLFAQLDDRSVATVHGDLTVENIIVAPGSGPGWYIIDPNPENIFDTPLIDWAKLMQSLHLGYEGLNRSFDCLLDGNRIRLSSTRSQVYSELHHHLETLIARYRGPMALREVYFHELINYLRLTPYKIRQNRHKGLCFFACTSLLLDRYLAGAR